MSPDSSGRPVNNLGYEGSAAYIQRARDAMRLAEETKLPARARIHLQAAERWTMLAERARRMERR